MTENGRAPVLELRNVSTHYGLVAVLREVDMEIFAGEMVCLLGGNASGKTTTLKTILGYVSPSEGEVVLDGEVVSGLSTTEVVKRGVSMVPENRRLFPDMTVEENLWMGGYRMARGASAKEAADRIFSKYPRLAARRRTRAGALSGGERRLLEISRALVMDPEVLLVDEPSIGLEPRFIDEVFEILTDLKSRDGKTVLMVEQNARKGLEFADVGYVLVAGRVAKTGTGRELLEDPEVGRLFLGG